MSHTKQRLLTLLLALLLCFSGCSGTNTTNSTDKSTDSSTPVLASGESNEASESSRSGKPRETTISAAEDNTAFNDFLTELFINDVSTDTLTLHYKLKDPSAYNITLEEVSFGDFNLDNLDEELADLNETLDSLEAFDYDSLSVSQQLTYDILYEELVNNIDSYNYIYYIEVLSPTLGIQAQLPVYMNEYTLYTKSDADDYIELLYQIKPYFEQLLAFEQKKSEMGLFMADFNVDAIIEQCEEFIKTPEENLLLEIFDDKLTAELPDLTTEEHNDYIQRNHDAVIQSVIPAYQMLIDGMSALKGTGVNDGGLCNFEDGKDYYEYLVKESTGSSKSVSKLIKLTENRIQQDITLISLVSSKSENIMEEFQNAVPSVTDPLDTLNYLQTAITEDFPEPVSNTYTVKYVHPSLEENLSPAFYMIPPIDDPDANVIYINNYHNDGSDPMQLFSTLAHEGYPGHLYQTTMFSSTNPHPLRQLLHYSGYVEGWATYVELQSYAWSGVNENMCDLLRANTDISLAICSRVDLGANYEGWTLTETEEYLAQFGFTADTAKSIFEAVITDPANYLSYYIGSVEFEELSTLAEDELDENFDPKEFHRFILETGPCQFDVLEKYLQIWIDSQK